MLVVFDFNITGEGATNIPYISKRAKLTLSTQEIDNWREFVIHEQKLLLELKEQKLCCYIKQMKPFQT